MKFSSTMGRIFIFSTGVVFLVLILICSWMVFSIIEVKYLSKSEHEEIVQIIRATGNFEEITQDGKLYSTSYLVKFKSGEEKEVNFNGDVDFFKGDNLKIKYLQTRFTKQILLINYDKLKPVIQHKS